jgi:ribosomal protein S18 acetylase RimI-like enzyme
LSKTVHSLSSAQLVEAIEAGIFRFWIRLGRSPRLGLYDGPDMIRLISEVPSPFCNNVLRALLAPHDIDSRIEATLAPYKARRLPVRWWTTPSTRPTNLGSLLEARGLIRMADVAGMAVHLPDLSEQVKRPPDLTVEPVSDMRTLDPWIQVLTIGVGAPASVGALFFDVLAGSGFELPWRHYIGWLKGEAVACSSLLLGEGGVAGIYFVATVPEARGQGIGSALTLVPLLDARAMGYRTGVLGATQMGLGVYQGLGFREYCKFGIYVWQGESAQGEQKVNGA